MSRTFAAGIIAIVFNIAGIVGVTLDFDQEQLTNALLLLATFIGTIGGVVKMLYERHKRGDVTMTGIRKEPDPIEIALQNTTPSNHSSEV